jgi:hypothetical protein
MPKDFCDVGWGWSRPCFRSPEWLAVVPVGNLHVLRILKTSKRPSARLSGDLKFAKTPGPQ